MLNVLLSQDSLTSLAVDKVASGYADSMISSYFTSATDLGM